MALVEVAVPDIGDFQEVPIIEVLVKPGDQVKVDQSLLTLESDKASMEIPSSHAGQVRELRVKIGDKVSRGAVILVLEADAATASPPAPAASAPAPSPPAAPAPLPVPPAPAVPAGMASQPIVHTHATAELPHPEPVSAGGRLPHASPSVRALARTLGVPLGEVRGSGAKGRITQGDVQGFVKAVMAGQVRTAAQEQKAPAGGGALPGLLPWPQIDFTRFGAVERVELSRIKKLAGANLHRNWVMIPHVTNHDDADITELEAFRVQLNKEYDKAGVKVTLLSFLIKAVVAALRKFPFVNASLDGDALVMKKYFHIGFAADTPNNLIVPVIKDADQKGILELAKETSELAARARDGKLGPSEMAGGCFSISSLGGIGGTYFSPIINAPEVAILGVCKSVTRPVWDGQGFAPRLILPLSLSYDHRVIDGAAAARFNAFLCQLLADFRRVVL
jgi:pyruvate dehydrogenase E2 component (dihydrolipoamide acetyltransferase)